MKKEIFKVGDRVYHISFGWGKITDIDNCNEAYQIQVSFENTVIHASSNLLSFTEYTLQGFSQERPIELPEVGELCLFRDSNGDGCWRGIEFKMYDKTRDFPFMDSNGHGWRQMKRIKILD